MVRGRTILSPTEKNGFTIIDVTPDFLARG
jgi:hypothetical protein